MPNNKKNKPLKIIELTSKSDSISLQNVKNDDNVYIFDSWAGLFARRLKELYPDLNIEVWSSKNRLERKKISIGKNGVTGILWPYNRPVLKNVLTLNMIKGLNRLSKNNCVIIHYHTLFDIRFLIYARFVRNKISVVLSHHGGIPPYDSKVRNFLFKLLFKRYNLKYVTYLTPETKYFIEKIRNHPPLIFLPVGADYDLHCGGNKSEARNKLGLNQNKIYALYVGSYYKLKSVDLILKIYYLFRKKYNFEIIFVGGVENSSNDLYEEVIKSGCPEYGHNNPLDMPVFYQASDFYIHPAYSKEFGGFDVSLIESLANNRPVLSSRLNYMDVDFSEFGVLLNNENEIFEKTEYMINNYHKFTKCREASIKYLDGKKAILEKLNFIYNYVYENSLCNNK